VKKKLKKYFHKAIAFVKKNPLTVIRWIWQIVNFFMNNF